MTRVRIALLTILFLAPFVVLFGIGGYHLYHSGNLWVWWPILGTMVLTYFLAWRWTRREAALPAIPTAAPEYWTDRDRLAWERVEARAECFEKITVEQLSNARHYADLSLDLATEIASIYNPDSEDPFDALTLPEVLACIELATADLNAMAQKYVPGIHLIRIRDTRRAKQALGWYKTGQDLYWAGAAVFDPISTGLRYLASRSALGGLLNRIQDNLALWFHTAFIRQLGRYLIELNSGRLKVGVPRYREILAQHQEPPAGGVEAPTAGPTAAETAGPRPITLAILGAVKAGKSSLVNAMLGKQSATVDSLPVASGHRYTATLTGGQPVSLLDTSGYGENGIDDETFAAAVEASCDADLILLVTAATCPGRQNDVTLLDRLKEWFDGKPHLRMPSVVVVVNQVDLLSPKAEWKPPYDWRAGIGAKETNIRECVAAVTEQMGRRAAEVVPACARAGETYGIVEGLVPAVVSHLDEARGAAILRAFEAGATERPVGKVFDQVGHVAQAAMTALGGIFKKK